ncbi:huntingtin-interacting K [Brachionus plicatilis]|uniref:Huntingtin-interacting K n=1 Tax=Brachionus plicatilis TaxID=10195 RepID=A0A3M7SU95_BRAPC|nr:huntingtin-interacting K [Brachionus plicatilis]
MDEANKESQAQAHSKHNTGAADLEKVTDFVEEKEISGDNLDNAITAILDKRKLEAEQKAELERRLASVKVKKEDVELICHEFEITKPKAERILKENSGDLRAALTALVNA